MVGKVILEVFKMVFWRFRVLVEIGVGFMAGGCFRRGFRV